MAVLCFVCDGATSNLCMMGRIAATPNPTNNLLAEGLVCQFGGRALFSFQVFTATFSNSLINDHDVKLIPKLRSCDKGAFCTRPSFLLHVSSRKHLKPPVN